MPSDPTQSPSLAENLFSDEQKKAPMTVYNLMLSYTGDMGLIQGRDATNAGSAPSVIIRTGPAIGTLEVRWEARRYGLPLELPAICPPTNSNAKLLEYRQEFPTISLDATAQTKIYQARGFAKYAISTLKIPEKVGAVYPSCPVTIIKEGINISQFNQTLLDFMSF